jgi:hypothetical protein
MLKIYPGNTLRVSKGESASVLVTIGEGAITAGDRFVFSVRPNAGHEEELIHVETANLPAGANKFHITIAAGLFAGVLPGTYKYDILRINGQDRNYITWPANFVIEEVVSDG